MENAMNKKPYVLGIIPARQRSKRLPGKNIRLLNGRPLIEYIIKTGLESKKIDKLIVTTDCKNIRKAAIESGASAPFLRPKELAQDNSLTEEALRHAVLFIESSLRHAVDIIVTLQPTAPFTTVRMIDNCIDSLLKGSWDTVITVEPVSIRSEWIGLINERGCFKQIINEQEYFKLSKIKEYAPSGNVYVFKRKVLFEQKKIIGKNTGVVVVSPEEAVDIDYLIDFEFAEFLLKKKHMERYGKISHPRRA